MKVQEYADLFISNGCEVVTLTNHGNLSDNKIVKRAAESSGILFVPGIEISTNYGDFLIFAPYESYLQELQPMNYFPPHVDRDEVAIVWAHPAAGGGMSGTRFDPSFIEKVVPYIDGIEVLNGNLVYHSFLPDINDTALRIAEETGLPHLGGSDCHHPKTFMRCFTLFNKKPESAEEFVQMIKKGEVSAGKFEGSFEKRDRENNGILRDLYEHMDLEFKE